MSFSGLPAVNAFFNGLSGVLLGFGFYYIKHKKVTAHRRCMVAAFVSSGLFLACYLTYHVYYLGYIRHEGPTIFRNPAWFRPIYLVILLTHTALAMVILPMAIMTLSRALRQRFDAHRRIARWTWPVWMYVSVTGVVIYLLLYQIFPQGPSGAH